MTRLCHHCRHILASEANGLNWDKKQNYAHLRSRSTCYFVFSLWCNTSRTKSWLHLSLKLRVFDPDFVSQLQTNSGFVPDFVLQLQSCKTKSRKESLGLFGALRQNLELSLRLTLPSLSTRASLLLTKIWSLSSY